MRQFFRLSRMFHVDRLQVADQRLTIFDFKGTCELGRPRDA